MTKYKTPFLEFAVEFHNQCNYRKKDLKLISDCNFRISSVDHIFSLEMSDDEEETWFKNLHNWIKVFFLAFHI